MRPDSAFDQELLRRQDGVVSRSQALAAGFTQSAITARIRSGRWQRLHDGVFLVSPVPPTFRQLAWAGLLAAGDGAVASHRTAAALHGMVDPDDGPVTVSVLAGAHPRRRTGLNVRRRRRIRAAEGSSPPCTGPLDTLLDLVADCRDPADVVGLLTLHVGRHGITPAALRLELHQRPMQPWRALALEVTEAVVDGVRSPLELRYRRDVEIAHGLPRPTRQVRRHSESGTVVRDLEYDLWRLVVELDGRLNHADVERVLRDLDRDNAAAAAGRSTLRYGWPDVAGRPCRAAGQVARALQARGWRGHPRRCGAACTL